jgi:broad specificity phosphatase PhoE
MSGLRLVLARHGQTPSNVRQALDSRPPGLPLTEEGRRQAAELGLALATEPVVAVYASVAVRARQTAAAVAGRHGIPVTMLDGVHEVDVGELEGATDAASHARFSAIYQAWQAGDLGQAMPGGESGDEVLARFLPAVERIRATYLDGVVVLVSHGAAVRLVAGHLASNVNGEAANSVLLPNTGRVVLELDGEQPAGWRCVEWTGITLR